VPIAVQSAKAPELAAPATPRRELAVGIGQVLLGEDGVVALGLLLWRRGACAGARARGGGVLGGARLLLMVRAKALAPTQRLGVRVLGRAGDRAAHTRLRLSSTAHTVVVAEGAAAAQRRGVGVERAAPHAALALAVLLDARAANACVLIGVVVCAEAPAAAQRLGD